MAVVGGLAVMAGACGCHNPASSASSGDIWGREGEQGASCSCFCSCIAQAVPGFVY